MLRIRQLLKNHYWRKFVTAGDKNANVYFQVIDVEIRTSMASLYSCIVIYSYGLWIDRFLCWRGAYGKGKKNKKTKIVFFTTRAKRSFYGRGFFRWFFTPRGDCVLCGWHSSLTTITTSCNIGCSGAWCTAAHHLCHQSFCKLDQKRSLSDENCCGSFALVHLHMSPEIINII